MINASLKLKSKIINLSNFQQESDIENCLIYVRFTMTEQDIEDAGLNYKSLVEFMMLNNKEVLKLINNEDNTETLVLEDYTILTIARELDNTKSGFILTISGEKVF